MTTQRTIYPQISQVYADSMRGSQSAKICAICGSFILFLFCTNLIAAPATNPSAKDDAKYITAITKRATDAVATLKIDDPAKADKVRDLIVAQYKDLRDLHEQKADTKALHDEFLSKLSADLSPEQVDRVKDAMTFNKVTVDFNAFCDMLPQLTDEQKAYIKTQLIEAREIAMDKGSSEEKHAVFGKYRGRINNYLSKQGYDLKQASKEWAERRKARASTQKAN